MREHPQRLFDTEKIPKSIDFSNIKGKTIPYIKRLFVENLCICVIEKHSGDTLDDITIFQN